MKPYREQSNTNPIMCSFGHRPKSASRTFHPGTMKIRLKKSEVAEPAPIGRNGFGLPPSVLSKLLHAPKIYHPGEEFDDNGDNNTNNNSNSLCDPHNLFLPNDDIFDKKKSKRDNDTILQQTASVDNLQIGEHGWSTTFSNTDQDQDQQDKQYHHNKKSPKKLSSKKSSFAKEMEQVFSLIIIYFFIIISLI